MPSRGEKYRRPNRRPSLRVQAYKLRRIKSVCSSSQEVTSFLIPIVLATVKTQWSFQHLRGADDTYGRQTHPTTAGRHETSRLVCDGQSVFAVNAEHLAGDRSTAGAVLESAESGGPDSKRSLRQFLGFDPARLLCDDDTSGNEARNSCPMAPN
ncbi:unnamed protein product [Protopolystoma xenopodis]|uniref:Uncharacterized protein n=1 Tax=Protopolystoma xenopodis TaxID=117903 RepID=A0A448XE36_9PLAT|nr:unnamed protein product [Protopolystoma xenopodis]